MKNLSLIALLLLSGCAEASQSSSYSPPATTFSGLYFSPTNGKVGYHMLSNNYFQQSPCAANEHATVGLAEGGITTVGTIPPGLMAPDASQGRFVFEGTPRQAGDWDVTVTEHYLTCSSVHGADGPKNYGDVTTTVHFHIDP
jgi:hypothetical protein